MNIFTTLLMFSLLFVVILGAGFSVSAGTITFSTPVDCEMGEECFIQNYVDTDLEEGSARDYRCGHLTYDGHKGTDFRLRDLPTMQEGVNVLAAADGVVKNTRDTLPDTGEYPAGQECGNGLTITHGGAYESQYCHMKQGSIAVQPGTEVTRGQVLGQIGLSGNTEFPHLHISIRQNGEAVDPFVGMLENFTCESEPEILWHRTSKTSLTYQTGILLNLHFAGEAPQAAAAREGKHRLRQLSAESEALVLWADVMAPEKADAITLEILLPNGEKLSENTLLLEKNRALQFVFSGKKRPPEGWPTGEYRGIYRFSRDGETIDSHEITIDLIQQTN